MHMSLGLWHSLCKDRFPPLQTDCDHRHVKLVELTNLNSTWPFHLYARPINIWFSYSPYPFESTQTFWALSAFSPLRAQNIRGEYCHALRRHPLAEPRRASSSPVSPFYRPHRSSADRHSPHRCSLCPHIHHRRILGPRPISLPLATR